MLSSKVRKKESGSQKLTVALVIHIYYTELAKFCASYVTSMPKGTDVYVTVPNEEKAEIVKNEFTGLDDYNIEYRIVGNIGRDVAPFLVGCKDIIDKYDLICKVHDKKCIRLCQCQLGLPGKQSVTRTY